MTSLIADTNNGLHDKLNLRILGTQIDTRATKTIAETTQHRLEIMLTGVETRAELGSYRRAGIGIGEVQLPKLDESTS
jgi:hypothetical protein